MTITLYATAAAFAFCAGLIVGVVARVVGGR